MLQFYVEQSDALVYCTPLVVAHLHPARDFVKGAQAISTNIIAQYGSAIADAGGVRGNFCCLIPRIQCFLLCQIIDAVAAKHSGFAMDTEWFHPADWRIFIGARLYRRLGGLL